MERVSFGGPHTNNNNMYSRKVPNYLPCNTNPVIYYYCDIVYIYIYR